MPLVEVDPSELPSGIRAQLGMGSAGTLLDFAKSHNLNITSGFSKGGHNSGSMHYHGSENDPGAIDIAPNVSYNDLIAWAGPQGYKVLDERQRPKGQAVWTGPHYHVQKSRGAQSSRPKSQTAPTQKTPAGMVEVSPDDLPPEVKANVQPPNALRPIQLNEQGVGVLPQSDLNQALMAVQQKGQQLDRQLPSYAAPTAPVNTQPQAIQQIGQRAVDSLNRPPEIATPQDLNELQSFLNAALNTGSAGILDLPTKEGFGKTAGSFAGPLAGTLAAVVAAPETGGASLAIPAAYMGLVGAGNTAREQFNRTGTIDNPLAVGTSGLTNAALGLLGPVGKGLGLLPRVGLNAGVNAVANAGQDIVQQAAEQGTLLPKLDLGRTGQSALIGAGLGGGFGALVKKVHAAHPEIAAKIDQGIPLEAAEQSLVGKILNPDEVQALNEAYKQRTVQPKEIITSLGDESQAIKDLGIQQPVQEQVSDTGLTVTREGAPKPPMDIEVQRGLPEGERVEPVKPLQTEAIIDPVTGQPYKAPEVKLRSAKDVAMERANRLDLESPLAQDTVPARPPETVTSDIPSRLDLPSKVLDSQGKPIGDVPTNAPDILAPSGRSVRDIEATARPELLDASGRTLDLPGEVRAEAPQSTVEDNVQARPDGGHVYTQGRDTQAVERLAQALEKNNQVVALEDAKKLLADKKAAGLLDSEAFQKQTDILNLFEEAGRTGKTFDSLRREIQEGEGRISAELGKAEVKTRDSLAPFAITVKERRPQTEVSSLVKRLGSSEAARDHLRQMAQRYGITPTTKAFGGAKADLVKSNATQIAKQIAKHPKGRLEFTDIYLNAHNFKTGGDRTATDAPRGYPLRTFEGANIGTEQAAIPTTSANQNAIAQQFNALEELKTAPDVSPELKQLVTKVTDNPNVSFKDIRKMRQLIGENLERFCSIWGLK